MTEADWRELAVALAAALVYSEDPAAHSTERKGRPCGCAIANRGTPAIAHAEVAQPETLNRPRAQKMHIELGRLGLKREAHYELAEQVLGREVKTLTALTDAEALAVLNAARRLAAKRKQPTESVSDEEAQAILN